MRHRDSVEIVEQRGDAVVSDWSMIARVPRVADEDR
jgi:hypothetical protein